MGQLIASADSRPFSFPVLPLARHEGSSMQELCARQGESMACQQSAALVIGGCATPSDVGGKVGTIVSTPHADGCFDVAVAKIQRMSLTCLLWKRSRSRSNAPTARLGTPTRSSTSTREDICGCVGHRRSTAEASRQKGRLWRPDKWCFSSTLDARALQPSIAFLRAAARVLWARFHWRGDLEEEVA